MTPQTQKTEAELREALQHAHTLLEIRNYFPKFKDFLEDLLKSAPDETIRYAITNGFIFQTHDLDFLSVIQLFQDAGKDSLIELLKDHIECNTAEMFSHSGHLTLEAFESLKKAPYSVVVTLFQNIYEEGDDLPEISKGKLEFLPEQTQLLYKAVIMMQRYELPIIGLEEICDNQVILLALSQQLVTTDEQFDELLDTPPTSLPPTKRTLV